MQLLYNPGAWFAIGIVVGLLLEFGGRFFFNWYNRPLIKVPKKNSAWRNVSTQAIVVFQDLPQEQKSLRTDIRAYRLKVMNKGRSAAENVAGTLEFSSGDERRICWYEGNQATITINAEDHSFLDVYGVDLVQSNVICFPTEHGWDGVYAKTLTFADKIEIKLRITAKNASSYTLNFEIDANNNCEPNITRQDR